MSKTQRLKGKVGELEVVNILKENNISAKRISMMETNALDKGDIEIEKRFIGAVKRGQHVPIFLQKSLGSCDFLFCRRDRQKWFVSMTLDQFLYLFKEAFKKL